MGMLKRKKEEKKSVKKTIYKEKKLKRNVQNAIHYDMMIRNGICVLDQDTYSSSLTFDDINYQIVKDEDQKSIFSRYMEILNSLGNENGLQLTINNRIIDEEEFEKNVLLELQDDDLDNYRQEYNQYLKDKITEGNNKINSEKYITYATKAEEYEESKRIIRQYDSEYKKKFGDLGCNIRKQDGYKRLEVLHSIFYPEGKFFFNYDHLDKHFTTKDAIAPESLDFSNPSYFLCNGRYCQILYLKNYSTELSDQMIQRLTSLETNLVISFHMKAIERGTDIALVKTTIAKMEMEIADTQRQALKMGYNPDMLPAELKYSYDEAHTLLEDVQQRNQRLFDCQFFVMINEPTLQEMEVSRKQVEIETKKLSCEMGVLRYQQEDALNAVLPLGRAMKGISRTLTTSACAIMIPFTSQELNDMDDSIYYGINSITKNMLLANRKKLKNPSGWIFGKPGSGKSFAAKRELFSAILQYPNDDFMVLDPEDGARRSYMKSVCTSQI